MLFCMFDETPHCQNSVLRFLLTDSATESEKLKARDLTLLSKQLLKVHVQSCHVCQFLGSIFY